MTYAATAAEILAVSRPGRRSHLVRRSDALLHRLEQVNVDAYLPYRPEQPVSGSRKVVRLPADLAQAVNDLLLAIGLPMRRLRTTSEALEAVWSALRRILGQPDDEDEQGE